MVGLESVKSLQGFRRPQRLQSLSTQPKPGFKGFYRPTTNLCMVPNTFRAVWEVPGLPGGVREESDPNLRHRPAQPVKAQVAQHASHFQFCYLVALVQVHFFTSQRQFPPEQVRQELTIRRHFKPSFRQTPKSPLAHRRQVRTVRRTKCAY